MKFNLFERAITCCLLGAGTIAIASGMKLTSHPTEGAGVGFVCSDDDDNSDDDNSDEDQVERTEVELDDDEDMKDGDDEGAIAKLIAEAHEASDENKEEKRIAIKDALTDTFRKRTQAQRTRIASMKEKLEAIESQLERRSNLEDQIVQRRLGELLGDKDELGWDHEPEIDLESLGNAAEPRQFLRRMYGFEFPKNYPTEYGTRMAMAMATDANLRSDPLAREQLLQAKKQVEQAERAASEVKRQFREVRIPDSAAVKDEVLSRIRRLKDLGKLEDLHTLERSLPDLEGVPKLLDGRQKHFEQLKGNDGDVVALRGKLEAMRAQSNAIELQIEAIAKKNAEAASSMPAISH